MSRAIASAWTEVLEPVANDGLGPVTVLRDYHAENIMLVEGRDGVAHFGLLDFQDALAGHPAYDLASVLEDARRDVAAGARASDDRPLRRRDRPWRAVRAGLLGARGAAQHAHPRSLHPAVEARQQAGLSPLPAAHVGPARARPGASRAGAGPRLVRRQCRRRASRRALGGSWHERGPPLAAASRRRSPPTCRAPRWSWPRASASACAR